MISEDRLKEVLHYDQYSGVFTWRVKSCRKVVKGAIAGGVNVAGYVVIGIDGKTYYAHQLAHLWMTGEWARQIDHRDGNRSNNSWSNLRPATHQQNILNAKRAKNNTSGFKGVSWQKSAGKFASYIILDGKKKHLGLFENAEDAHQAYMAAASEAHPEFARAS